MAPASTAFISLSVGQTIAILVMTLAAIALAYLLGKDEGREAARRELRQKASEDAADRFGLVVDRLGRGARVTKHRFTIGGKQ